MFVSRDDEVLLDKMSAEDSTDAGAGQDTASHKTTLDYHLDMRKIFDFATKEARVEDISFMLDAARMNKALAEEGLAHPYGLQVGRTIQNNIHRQVFGKGLLTHCMAMTAAASDARMAGCTLPAMSNSGSGNQGITVTMPVVAAAEQFGSSKEQLIVLALDNHCVTGNDGIIEDDVEKSIRNLGTIGSKGMQVTDEMILNIMVCK